MSNTKRSGFGLVIGRFGLFGLGGNLLICTGFGFILLTGIFLLVGIVLLIVLLIVVLFGSLASLFTSNEHIDGALELDELFVQQVGLIGGINLIGSESRSNDRSFGINRCGDSSHLGNGTGLQVNQVIGRSNLLTISGNDHLLGPLSIGQGIAGSDCVTLRSDNFNLRVEVQATQVISRLLGNLNRLTGLFVSHSTNDSCGLYIGKMQTLNFEVSGGRQVIVVVVSAANILESVLRQANITEDTIDAGSNNEFEGRQLNGFSSLVESVTTGLDFGNLRLSAIQLDDGVRVESNRQVFTSDNELTIGFVLIGIDDIDCYCVILLNSSIVIRGNGVGVSTSVLDILSLELAVALHAVIAAGDVRSQSRLCISSQGSSLCIVGGLVVLERSINKCHLQAQRIRFDSCTMCTVAIGGNSIYGEVGVSGIAIDDILGLGDSDFDQTLANGINAINNRNQVIVIVVRTDHVVCTVILDRFGHALRNQRSSTVSRLHGNLFGNRILNILLSDADNSFQVIAIYDGLLIGIASIGKSIAQFSHFIAVDRTNSADGPSQRTLSDRVSAVHSSYQIILIRSLTDAVSQTGEGRNNVIASDMACRSDEAQVRAFQNITIDQSCLGSVTSVFQNVHGTVIRPIFNSNIVAIDRSLGFSGDSDGTLVDNKINGSVNKGVVVCCGILNICRNDLAGTSVRSYRCRSTLGIGKVEGQVCNAQHTSIIRSSVALDGFHNESIENQVVAGENRVLIAVNLALGSQSNIQRSRSDFKGVVYAGDVEVDIVALDNHRVLADILTSIGASVRTNNLQICKVACILAHIVSAVASCSPSQCGVSLTVDLLLAFVNNHDYIALIDMQRTINKDDGVIVLCALVFQTAHGDDIIASSRTSRNLGQRTVSILDVVDNRASECGSNGVIVLQASNGVAERGNGAAINHGVTASHSKGDLNGLDGQSSNFHSFGLGGGRTNIDGSAGASHDGDGVVAVLVVQSGADGIFTDILTGFASDRAAQSTSSQFQRILLQTIVGNVAGNLGVRECGVCIAVILLVVGESQGDGTRSDGDGGINHRQVVVGRLCVDSFQSISANACGSRSCTGSQGNALKNLFGFCCLNISSSQQTSAALDVILHIHRSEGLTIGLFGFEQVDNGSTLIDGEANIIGEADTIVLCHRLLIDVTAVNRISASVLACFTAQTSLCEISLGFCEAGGIVVEDDIGIVDCKAGVSLAVSLGQAIARSDGQGHLMNNQHVLTIGLRQLNAVCGLVIQTEGQVVRTCIVQTRSVRSSLNGDTNNTQRNILAVHLDIDGFAIVVNLSAIGGIHVDGNFLGDGVGLLLTVSSLQGVEGDRDISLGDLERSLRSNRYDVIGVLIIGDGSLIVANNRGGVFPLGQVDVDVQRASLRVNHIDSLRTGLVIQRIAGGVLTGNAVLTNAVGSTLDGDRQCIDSQRTACTIAVSAGINDVVVGVGVTGNNNRIGTDTSQLANGIVNAILDGDSAAQRSDGIMDADFIVACEVLVFQCAGNVGIAGILCAIQTLTVRNGDGQSTLCDSVLIGSIEGDVVVLGDFSSLELCIAVSVRANSLADLTSHNAASKVGTNTATLAIDGVKSKGNAALGITVAVNLRLTTHHIDGDRTLGDGQLAVDKTNQIVVVTVVVLAIGIGVPVRRPTLLRSTLHRCADGVFANIGSCRSAAVASRIHHGKAKLILGQTDACLCIVQLETFDGFNLARTSSTIHCGQVIESDSQHCGMDDVLAVDDLDVIVSSACRGNFDSHRIFANILIVDILTLCCQNHADQLVHTVISGDVGTGDNTLIGGHCLSSTVISNSVEGDGRRLALFSLTIDGINLVVGDGYVTLGNFKRCGSKVDVITIDRRIRLDIADCNSIATGSGGDAGQNNGGFTAQTKHLFQSNCVGLVLIVGLILEIRLIGIRPTGNHEVNLRILLTILTSSFAAGRLYAIIALEDKYGSQGQSLFGNDNIHIAGIGLNVDVVVRVALRGGT